MNPVGSISHKPLEAGSGVGSRLAAGRVEGSRFVQISPAWATQVSRPQWAIMRPSGSKLRVQRTRSPEPEFRQVEGLRLSVKSQTSGILFSSGSTMGRG